ncbi:MAG TPA: peptidoglycan DD-metalloendopeptidase family protein [Burkholderiaceae bacterium]|nr:peptidoglycan DD-metalloendopeptidase family protein [Burkholderiaceae bacterium]
MRSSGVLRLSLPCLLLLGGCATVSLNEAPIVDRTARSTPAPVPAPAPGAAVPRQAADGVYVVQRGDTLYSIALAFQQDFRDVARWNNLDDPTRLQVGQALRVAPPQNEVAGAAVAAPVTGSRGPEARPLDGAPLASAPATAASPARPPDAAPAAPAAGAAAPTLVPPDVTPASSPFGWAWPASGAVVESFDATRTKGIGIGGKEGDPVNAAADGTVVYSGATLRGYGNLIIVKHDDEFISAYAHNRQILVKQGQAVKRGQRIAELGKTDADKPKLHFEIRRGGKPVDPQLYLPRR